MPDFARLTIYAALVLLGACYGEPEGVDPTDAALAPQRYNRSAFGGWADTDRDCMNTRHELLAELSTAPVSRSPEGCRVVRGRWLDPYTGRTFVNAADVEIDHVVPLAWAWHHGAWRWSDERRRAFGNDPRNLFAVEASENRQKGADGPTEWLPTDPAFHCQYVLRFTRVMQSYELEVSAPEEAALEQLRARTCGT